MPDTSVAPPKSGARFTVQTACPLDCPDACSLAVTVERGATLQYGTGSGTTGVIGHYQQVPGLAWNTLNHRVDGTLDLAVGRLVHPGIISGTGLVTARRFLWPGISLAGDHPFTGVLFNGTGVAYGESDYPAALSKARAVINQGSFICYAPTNTTVTLAADLYSRNYGNDVNFHTMPGGLVVVSGVYSWSDNSSMTAPAARRRDASRSASAGRVRSGVKRAEVRSYSTASSTRVTSSPGCLGVT
jgi:hypothetical protein